MRNFASKIWTALGLSILAYVVFHEGAVPKAELGSAPRPQAKKSQTLAAPVFRRPASAAAAAPSPSPTPLQRKIKDLRDLKACYESHGCPFPESDPRSYEIALGKKISEELKNLRLQFSKVAGAQRDLAGAAREFLATGDGFVQEEALRILSELPPSQENLNAITENFQSTPDPSLMEQVLGECRRYIGTEWENQVHAFLNSALASGAQFSSIAVSEKIQPFLNAKSYSSYEKTLSTMTPGAKSTKNLSAALKEYRRLQTGA